MPGTFWKITKKFKLFPGGASPPSDPPSSWLLSQPPRDRFERLRQVGGCRGLQRGGGKCLVNGLAGQPGHPQPGLPIPELFSGPHSGTFSCTFFATFPENSANNVDPADPTKFVAFPGNAANFVGSAGSTLFEEFPGNATKNVQKKVPEWGPEKSSGTCRPCLLYTSPSPRDS